MNGSKDVAINEINSNYNCFKCYRHYRCPTCNTMIHSYNHKIKIENVMFHHGCVPSTIHEITKVIESLNKKPLKIQVTEISNMLMITSINFEALYNLENLI